VNSVITKEEVSFEALGSAHNRAVVAVLNALNIPHEDEAEEMVDSIVALVFETMKQYLNDEAENELSYN